MHIKKKSIDDLKDILLEAKYKNLIKDVKFYDYRIAIYFYPSDDLADTALTLQKHIKDTYQPIKFFYKDVVKALMLEVFHFENYNPDQSID